MNGLAEVRNGLDEAGTAVDAARTLIDQGDLIDLSSLEQHVGTVCDAAARLPGPEQTGLKTVLITLIEKLNGLAEIIATERDKLSGALTGMSDHRRATTAYGSSPDQPARTDTKKRPPEK